MCAAAAHSASGRLTRGQAAGAASLGALVARLGTVVHLSARGHPDIDAAALADAVLAAPAAAAALHGLDLGKCGVGWAGAARLLALPALEEAVLHGNRLSEGAAEALADPTLFAAAVRCRPPARL